MLLALSGIEVDGEITNALKDVSHDDSKIKTINNWVNEEELGTNTVVLGKEIPIQNTNGFDTNVSAVVSNIVLKGDSAIVATENDNPYYDFKRYRIILERKPFGDFDAAAAAAAAANANIIPPALLPNFAKNYSMCASTDSYGEIMVGFIDKGKKSGTQYYYLRVGEENDGVTLVAADYANESATLLREGQKFDITMSGPKLAGSSPTKEQTGARPLFSRSKSQKNQSYSSRLKKHRESRIKVESRIKYPKENMSKEEITEHLRKLNMELIRAQGSKGPPLPLQLTPEEDAQLVSEGVLDAVEPVSTE